jgi:hypothetical protein
MYINIIDIRYTRNVGWSWSYCSLSQLLLSLHPEDILMYYWCGDRYHLEIHKWDQCRIWFILPMCSCCYVFLTWINVPLVLSVCDMYHAECWCNEFFNL